MRKPMQLLLVFSALISLCSCAMHSPNSEVHRIEEASYISIGGIDQWVTMRGDDDRKPVLLVVHGGPADVQSPFVSSYAPYERDFVLVQWDQRGAARKSRTPTRLLPQAITHGIPMGILDVSVLDVAENTSAVAYYSAMPASIYIESSIIGYLTARPSRDVVSAARQAITLDWWQKQRHRYEVYISALVELEISGGDEAAAEQRVLAVTGITSVAIKAEAQALASALIAEKAIPANSVEDALHIAIAATQGADFLLTWNFKHINNAETKRLIAKVVESNGYVCPILCSPEELGGVRDE